MPLKRILVDDGIKSSPIKLEADSIGNRKPKCTNIGFCTASQNNFDEKYRFQIPCESNGDCVFYESGFKKAGSDELQLINGTCKTYSALEKLDLTTMNQNIFETQYDNPEGYGNRTDMGCSEKYYEFYLSGYTTPGMEIKPKVQVLDNWGWCSGECDTSNYPAGLKNIGCYNDNGIEDCVPENGNIVGINPWVIYKGKVIVK